MEILPAIDLRAGKVVRLQRGDYDRQTTYSDDPSAVAETFLSAGARWIHVVDLDAAKSGRQTNLAAVKAILNSAGASAKVELGGGIRDEETIRSTLEMGVSRVVIGSSALADWAWFSDMAHRSEFAGRLALGLDARGGLLAVHGWTQQTQATAIDVASKVRTWPLGAIVYTDINRDGMLEGPNIPATAELVAATDVPIIASGGVSTISDVRECKRIGCAGAIIGKAYYEGKLNLADACAAGR
jgi:phosphoribosylformimino-5-aminoimidazole carboxamide ribotide isomerase